MKTRGQENVLLKSRFVATFSAHTADVVKVVTLPFSMKRISLRAGVYYGPQRQKEWGESVGGREASLRRRFIMRSMSLVWRAPRVSRKSLLIFEELIDGKAGVFCDPTQQEWRDISTRVEGNGCASSIRMTELLVRTTLPDLGKTEVLQNRSYLARLEYRHLCHGQGSETR